MGKTAVRRERSCPEIHQIETDIFYEDCCRRGSVLTAGCRCSALSDVFSMSRTSSRWVYDKFKDDVHFYLAIMGIPLGAAITLANLLYSNAQLSAIPEGYTPKEWEYHPNPI